MANRTAAKTQARPPTQTASRPQAQETPSFLARCILPHDLTILEAHHDATAPGGADEPQRGTPRRLPLEPGVCDHAQRTPGGGIGLLAQASQRVPCDRTGQLCQRDSSRLWRCSRCLLLALE